MLAIMNCTHHHCRPIPDHPYPADLAAGGLARGLRHAATQDPLSLSTAVAFPTAFQKGASPVWVPLPTASPLHDVDDQPPAPRIQPGCPGTFTQAPLRMTADAMPALRCRPSVCTAPLTGVNDGAVGCHYQPLAGIVSPLRGGRQASWPVLELGSRSRDICKRFPWSTALL